MTQEWIPVQPETPELDRMIERATAGHSQDIGEFIEWLDDTNYNICEWHGGEYNPVHRTPEQWLAEFFGIDLDKVEKERALVLEYMRSKNEEANDG